MATTAVDICNLALGSLGLEPINSITTPTNQEERTCALFYEKTRDNYLREHNWSFASIIAELTKETTDVDGYDWAEYKYTIPSDCLKAQQVMDGSSSYAYPFVIGTAEIAAVDTKLIFTNLDNAFLLYTLAITDPDYFDSSFLMALSKKLAFEISWPLTKDAKVQKQAYEQYILEDNRAKQKDASEQLPEADPVTWRQASRGAFGGYWGYWGGYGGLYN